MCWSEARTRRDSAEEFLGFDFRDLRDSALVTTTLECSGEKDSQDLLGETNANNARTHAEHIGVVVFSGHSSGVQVVAQRGTNTTNLVRRQLLALTAATQNDAQIGATVSDRSAHRSTDRRVVTTLRAVGAMVCHHVTARPEHADEVLLQFETGVVRPDRNS